MKQVRRVWLALCLLALPQLLFAQGPLTSVSLASPAAGAVNVAIPVTVAWSGGNKATTFEVKLGTTNYPTTVVATCNSAGGGSAGCSTTAKAYTATLAPAVKYFWRITARNAKGTSTSATRSFTTAVLPPPLPPAPQPPPEPTPPPAPTPVPEPTPTPTPGAQVATHRVDVAGVITRGQAFPPGRVPAGRSLQVESYPTQMDVKLVHPDGSVAHAALHYRATTTGPAKVSLVTASTVTAFVPTWPTVDVVFAPPAQDPRGLSVGQVYTARIPAPADRWFSGPLVVEGRSIVKPITSSGTAHPDLFVIADLRAYAGGGFVVDVTPYNGVNTPTLRGWAYTLSIVVNGQTVKTIPNVSQATFTRPPVRVAVGLTEGAAQSDRAVNEEAKAIPRFRSDITGPTYDNAGLDVFLGFGSLQPGMSAAGVRPELSLYPDYTADCLSTTSPSACARMFLNADAAGSWSLYPSNDPKTLGPIAFHENPAFNWIVTGFAANGGRDSNTFGASSYDNAHHGSHVFVPYLMTVRRYYRDLLEGGANAQILMVPDRHGALGVFHAGEMRGVAHALRNISDAARWLPRVGDGASTLAPELWRSVNDTLGVLDYIVDAPASGLFPPNAATGIVGGTPFYGRREGTPYMGSDPATGRAVNGAPELDLRGRKMWWDDRWQTGWAGVVAGWLLDRGFTMGQKFRDTVLLMDLRWWMLAPTVPHTFISIINPGGYYTDVADYRTYRFYETAQEVLEAHQAYAYNRRNEPPFTFVNGYGGNPCGYGYWMLPSSALSKALEAAGDARFAGAGAFFTGVRDAAYGCANGGMLGTVLRERTGFAVD